MARALQHDVSAPITLPKEEITLVGCWFLRTWHQTVRWYLRLTQTEQVLPSRFSLQGRFTVLFSSFFLLFLLLCFFLFVFGIDGKRLCPDDLMHISEVTGSHRKYRPVFPHSLRYTIDCDSHSGINCILMHFNWISIEFQLHLIWIIASPLNFNASVSCQSSWTRSLSHYDIMIQPVTVVQRSLEHFCNSLC